MRFENGERIKIKTINELIREFGPNFRTMSPSWTDAMDKFAGKTTTISHAGIRSNLYRLGIDEGCFAWIGEWLRKVEKLNIKDNLFEL